MFIYVYITVAELYKPPIPPMLAVNQKLVHALHEALQRLLILLLFLCRLVNVTLQILQVVGHSEHRGGKCTHTT